MAYRVDAPENNEEANTLVVLEKGMSISHTVLSFPVFTVKLRRVQLQWVNAEGEHQTFHTFMRECGLLNHSLLAVASVMCGYKNAFFVKVCNPSLFINGTKYLLTYSFLLLVSE